MPVCFHQRAVCKLEGVDVVVFWLPRFQEAFNLLRILFGVVNVVLEWTGKVVDYGQTYEEFHKAFSLVVKNYTSDGGLAMDPVEHRAERSPMRPAPSRSTSSS